MAAAGSGDGGTDTGADLRIGPTTLGMVRISVEPDGGRVLDLDFDPDEAEAIAEELRAAAAAARAAADRAAADRGRQARAQTQAAGKPGSRRA